MVMRFIVICLWLTSYVLTIDRANAQTFDPTIDIGNQVDENVSRALQTQTASGSSSALVPSSEEYSARAIEQKYQDYSGFLIPPPPGTPVQPVNWWEPKETLLQETFNEKNSFLGTGVTDGYTSQVGLDFRTPFGTDIQPFFVYQHASRDLVGTTIYRADSYGGSLGITQKLFPLIAGQPLARYNLGDSSNVVYNAQGYAPDYYPNFDLNLGLNFNAASTDVSNLKKGTWADSTQATYGLAPSLIFGFYFKRPNIENKFSLIPASVTIVPTYSDQMVMANNGTSGSNGILSIQDRNTYVWVVHQTDLPIDVQPTPTETIEVTESNTLLHDSNQEPLTASTPTPYQNWAKFGLALAYRHTEVVRPGEKKSGFWIDSVKVEYTYEAFNAQYEARNVVASLNIKF